VVFAFRIRGRTDWMGSFLNYRPQELLYPPLHAQGGQISEPDKEGDHVAFPQRGRRRISGSTTCTWRAYLDVAETVDLRWRSNGEIVVTR